MYRIDIPLISLASGRRAASRGVLAADKLGETDE